MNHFRRAVPFIAVVAAAAFTIRTAVAELPPRSGKQLMEDASHIVTGTVQQVYRTYVERKAGYGDDGYAVEIRVESVDKGSGPTRGEVCYVRGWQMAERPDGWVGASGCRAPAVGAKVRAYVTKAKEDGGYDVLLPNGFANAK